MKTGLTFWFKRNLLSFMLNVSGQLIVSFYARQQLCILSCSLESNWTSVFCTIQNIVCWSYRISKIQRCFTQDFFKFFTFNLIDVLLKIIRKGDFINFNHSFLWNLIKVFWNLLMSRFLRYGRIRFPLRLCGEKITSGYARTV